MIELSLQQSLTQTLELLLSPRLLQQLKILQVPYAELVAQITKESEENVLLEVERQDEYVEFIRYLTSDKTIKKEADFDELPGLENVGSVIKTLEEHLLDQLALEDLEEPYLSMGKMIIESIDDFGLVINYPRLREKLMEKFNVSRPTVDKALKIIQGFEPEGVGARDVKECLLIQLAEHNFENKALEEIITKVVNTHLKDLSLKEYAKIAQALAIPESGVEEIANFIKNNLNPNPGSSFGGATKHVIPSFAVEQTEKTFKLINLETRYGPKINISGHYLKMIDDPKTDSKTKAYLREKFKRAKNLLEDYTKRRETLEKIVRKIIATQGEFLTQGISRLTPLSQKSLADEFGLHPSTISRGVAEKYIQTPQGLFPLKVLCPRGPKGLTVPRLKAMLVNIIKNEDRQNPLSDSQITKLMKADGANIDRRTVAHYRQELKLKTYDERIKND